MLIVRQIDLNQMGGSASLEDKTIYMTKQSPSQIDFSFMLKCSQSRQILVHVTENYNKCEDSAHLTHDGEV